MSINLKKRLDLPDASALQTSDPAVKAHLKKLNECIQDLNRRVRDALVSNRVSGTLIWDDGTNYRITIVLDHGAISSVTQAASSGATASWTAA